MVLAVSCIVSAELMKYHCVELLFLFCVSACLINESGFTTSFVFSTVSIFCRRTITIRRRGCRLESVRTKKKQRRNMNSIVRQVCTEVEEKDMKVKQVLHHKRK
jgi:hypothetical protein